MRLVLFDVDGTLTRGAGAGARALERVFEERYGWPQACRGLRFHGGTDRGLVRQILEARGEAAPVEIDAVLARYVEIFPEEIPARPYTALPGAAAILDAMASEGVAVGLVTGNHPVAAEGKLRSAGLWRAFEIGAFGSESEDRATLVRLAVERAERRLGTSAASVFVVGDTERDVRAAHGARAKAVAVLTGDTSRETIEAESPHAVFRDLEEAHVARFWRS